MMNATYSPDDNKLRLYASARLDSDTYARVKAHGFKWAPRQQLFVAPMWTPAREDLLLDLCGEIGDEDTSLCERAEERAERFDEYSDKRLADAEAARKAVSAIADNIPFGQPILVGHHSEKHARRDKEKIDAGMRKAVKMWNTSKYWEDRAAGALRHAKYKELPTVRHRRIKTIESDKRKLEKDSAEVAKQLKAWQIVAGIDDADKQRAAGLAVANVGGYWSMSFPLADYPRDPPASQYEGAMGLWSAIDGGVIKAAKAAAIAIPSLERSLPRKARWLEHYNNRLAYERTMLAEQIGADGPSANPLADRFAFAVGGQVIAGRGRPGDTWETVTKVNKGVNGSVSSIQTMTAGPNPRAKRWRVESVHDYRAPTAETTAAAKAAAKVPPLCNYPGEGFAHLTQADYDKVPKDYRGYRVRAATETTGAHRTRSAIGVWAFRGTKCDDNKRHSYAPVFITDAKRVDPPKPIPPSEPADAAEFVAEFVSPPQSLADSLAELDAADAAKAAAQDAARAAPSDPADEMPAGDDVAAEAGPLPVTADSAAPSGAADFEAMARQLKAGGAQVVTAHQLFPTPASLAAEMVGMAGIEAGQNILEPSAGTGNIVWEIIRTVSTDECPVTAVEINATLCESLRRAYGDVFVHCGDFLDFDPPAERFDKVLMNPPFVNGEDIKHIEHARKFLKPGGRLVAICANGPRQRARLQPIASEWRDLPAGTFKDSGTMVNAALLVIDAPPG